MHSNIKDELLKKMGNKCSNCGKTIDFRTAVIEHIIPISEGGTNDLYNLSISCLSCNLLKADNIIKSIGTPFYINSVVKFWIHAFIKEPKTTIFISILIVLFSFFGIYTYEKKRKINFEKNLQENQTFTSQLNNLTDTEKNLKQLLSFVNSQKTQMLVYEKTINTLKSEKESLEPLLMADKKVIDALFKKQEERALANAEKERWWGVLYGVIASIIATFILYICKYFYVSYKSKEN